MIHFAPIPLNLKDRRILMRVDFNVPLKQGKVESDFRLLRTLPSIQQVSRKGGRIILMSHLEIDDRYYSLRGVGQFLKSKLKGFRFSSTVTGQKVKRMIDGMEPGDVLLLEDLRLEPGEKSNSPAFAKELALLGDLYINEAFSVSHRRHTSIVGIPEYLPSFAGSLFRKEVKILSRAFKPPRPFLFILGGNKFATKAPFLEKFLKKADTVVIGGAMIAPILLDRTSRIGRTSSKILMPRDVVVLRGKHKKTIPIEALEQSDLIYDLGPKSIARIVSLAKKSRFILWNGPLGYLEGGFIHGTLSLARVLGSVSAEVIVGGGDTASFLDQQKLLDKFSFVSTAGGAMLDFLVEETLPGIEVLEK